MNNKRVEVPYSVRIQQTKDRLRAKRAQMEKNVHIRSKVVTAMNNEELNVSQDKENNTVVSQSRKVLLNTSKSDIISDSDRKNRLRQMVIMSEILSKPVSMRKRRRRRGNP